MSTFDEAVEKLLADETGRLNPHDNGRGPSRWGVTLASYREIFPSATEHDIFQLGRQQAIAFYRRQFWERYHLGLLKDQSVATKVLNLGANIGQGTAVKFLQRAIGAQPVDGVLGPRTAAAANAIAPAKLLDGIRTAGAQYYRELVQRRPEYAGLLNGWLERLRG